MKHVWRQRRKLREHISFLVAISDYLPLTKHEPPEYGNVFYTAGCPFHDPDLDSRELIVLPDLQEVVCPACRERWDAVTFKAAYERVNETEAVAMLQERFGPEETLEPEPAPRFFERLRVIPNSTSLVGCTFLGSAREGLRLCQVRLRNNEIWSGSVPADCCYVTEGDEFKRADDGLAKEENVSGFLKMEIVESRLGYMRAQVPNGPILEWTRGGFRLAE